MDASEKRDGCIERLPDQKNSEQDDIRYAKKKKNLWQRVAETRLRDFEEQDSPAD